jgi:predicted RNase H-like nuclease (RuvC/YqgF family)
MAKEPIDDREEMQRHIERLTQENIEMRKRVEETRKELERIKALMKKDKGDSQGK